MGSQNEKNFCFCKQKGNFWMGKNDEKIIRGERNF